MEAETGIGFWGIFVLILVVFKAAGTLKIAWKWIFFPIWGPFALFAVVGTVYVIGALII